MPDAADSNGQTKVTIALLGQSIESLRSQMHDGFETINKSFNNVNVCIQSLETRVRCLETTYTSASGLRDLKLQSLATSVEDLDKRMEKVEEVLPGLKQAVRLLSWIGTVLGVAVLGLIWKLITGEVQLIP